MKKLLLFILVIIIGSISAYLFIPQIKGTIQGIIPIIKRTQPIDTSSPLPFSVPEGFSVALYATNTPGARVMTRAPNDTLLVSLTGEGKVVALPDNNQDKKADRLITILENLNRPHGLAIKCSEGLTIDEAPLCTLYVAETDAVKSYSYDPILFEAEFIEELTGLPGGDNHFTRSLLLHPNGEELLVSIGSSCNVCNEDDPRRAAIISINLENNNVSQFARGLRNTVFMEIHPVTNAIWGTDMGRDLLGDDLPPDEINIIEREKNYGWPTCYGKNIHDTAFDQNTYIRAPCSLPFEVPSHIDIPAHSAPLGIGFIPEEGPASTRESSSTRGGWPEKYWYDSLVAYHGSWNRSVPTEYKVVRLPLDQNGNPEGEPMDFMTGFFTSNNEVLGRPVGILIEPGGVMYVTDDRAGVVYVVSYQN